MILRLIIDKGQPTPALAAAGCRGACDADGDRPCRAPGGGDELERRGRRIWDVDPQAVALAMGVLLRRDEIEQVLQRTGHPAHPADREDALREALVRGCARRCALAEAVEHLLDGHTNAMRAAVERCPMMQIAEWWSRERDRLSAEEAAALLWRLASDPRPLLEPLVSRVGGHLCVRALELLRESHAAGASPRPSITERRPQLGAPGDRRPDSLVQAP